MTWTGKITEIRDYVRDYVGPATSGNSYATAALTADTSFALADHAATRYVIVSNPSTASNPLWVSATASAALGVGTEIGVGESRTFHIANSNLLSVRSLGTQAVGYTVL
jgi:hypothetical protein